MNLTENAKTVIERRIAARDDKGDPLETADQVFIRVAKNIAEADANYNGDVEKAYNKFLRLLSSLDFIPNSPTLVNAGRELQQLSACFVIPVEDSMEGIFESVKQAALIHKTGGGTGFSFSRLRPGGSGVNKTSGIASGPVSFMQVFDKATEVIKQGGTRRGANMGILRVDHPDIEEFINIKNDLTKMNNFNISVAITDEFINALGTGKDYDIIDPVTKEKVGTKNSKHIWNSIIESAHRTGDPGVIFIDRINRGRANPVPSRGPVEATNPCGEQPLYPWDSCNLGSINLSNFVLDGKVDFPRLAEVSEDAVHFLDNVIDMNKWPNEHIKEVSLAIRRIGLGVMGWADMLIKLGIPYNSEEAVAVGSEVMKCIGNAADKKSIQLGLTRGSFPDFDKSIYNEIYPAMRNSTRTTIAPTGTISIIAGCSSGIEPLFALEFERSHYLDKTDPNKRTVLTEYHSEYKKWLDANGKTENIPDYFVTSHNIDPMWHLMHQAAFQAYTDNAVSKTINFPSSATIDDIDTSYITAYLSGCMGVTIYRDGSRENQVLNLKQEHNEEIENIQEAKAPIRHRLGNEREAINHRFTVGSFDGYISVGLFPDGRPGEVFLIGNKSGSTTRGYLDTIGSILSISLQYGVPLDKMLSKLTGSRFEPSGFTGNPDIPVAASVMDYIARWLQGHFEKDRSTPVVNLDVVDTHEANGSIKGEASGNFCPECDGLLIYEEGCEKCPSCFYSKCG